MSCNLREPSLSLSSGQEICGMLTADAAAGAEEAGEEGEKGPIRQE
jgi:hypothetical protein